MSGFERNTMNYISGSRVSEVELGFTTLRKAVKKDLGVEAAQEAADAAFSRCSAQLERMYARARREQSA